MALNRGIAGSAVVLAALLVGGAARAADRPYTEGPVSVVTSVRTESGMFDDYMAWLAGPWKQEMEAQKKAGLIVEYKIFATSPRNPNEPDLYLMITYKNWASFDGLTAKLDAITEKMSGSIQKANAEAVARGKMRKILGDEIMQELNLK
jgi:hypothetical protein